MLLKYITCLLLICSCILQTFPTCPKPYTNRLKTLHLPKFTGTWYEIARTTNIPYEKGECSRSLYTIKPNGNFGMINAVFLNGTWYSMSGEAVATTTPFKFIVTFDSESGEFHVLDTDYKNYAIIYSCGKVGDVITKYVWIMSRTKTITPIQVDYLLNIVKTKLNIERSDFHFTNQSSDVCNVYFPLF